MARYILKTMRLFSIGSPVTPNGFTSDPLAGKPALPLRPRLPVTSVRSLRFFTSALCSVLAVIGPGVAAPDAGPSFNVPLDHPVYSFIDMLPLPPVAKGVSLSNRPFTEQQVCSLLVYAANKISSADKRIIDYYLREFSRHDDGPLRPIRPCDVAIDGKKTHAYPFITTVTQAQDSAFSPAGCNAFSVDSLSPNAEGYNKTVAGGRFYLNRGGFVSFFEGTIVTEYGSRQLWWKSANPRLGQLYNTIMAERGKPAHMIGYDDYTTYIKAPLSWCDLMIGNERVAWGYCSSSGLMFSGLGRPFLQTRFFKSIGKLDYTFVFGKFLADTYEQNRVIYAKHMSFAPAAWCAVGLSDAVITINREIVAPFFLPFVPFYFIDHVTSDRDNRIMAFDAQVTIGASSAVYGELFIDEISGILGVLTNRDVNDRWAGVLGVKWFNPLPLVRTSLVKAEVVQLEPWVYTTSTRSGTDLSNYPVHYGQPIGNPLGPHSRKLSLDFSCLASEKIGGSIGVSHFWKGIGPGSDVFSPNSIVTDTINGVPVEHQKFEGEKKFRFTRFSRDRTVISAGCAYSHRHWLRVAVSGDYALERAPANGSYFRVGIDTRVNY